MTVPALETKMSILGDNSCIRLTAAKTSSFFDMSHCMISARRPRAFIWSAVPVSRVFLCNNRISAPALAIETAMA